MSNSYDNWCPEVYRSLFVDRYNNDQILVAPCCQASASIESVDQFDFNTSPTLAQYRKQFDQGLKPVGCNSCWNVEALGHKSRRLSAIEFFKLESKSNTVELQSIDHSATWACNMACVMCGPNNSSLWATELEYNAEQLTAIGRKFQKDNSILDQLDLASVKKIHFNGGEPFLNDHQLALLQRLEEQNVLKNLFISYNTNGSIYPSDKIIEFWSKSRLVKLFFSIDATGAAYEYIRWPGKWTEVSNNIRRMREQLPGNVMFGLNVTVGNYNLLELNELWQWFQSTVADNRQGDLSDFNWQLANNFDPKNARPDIKQAVIEQLTGIDSLAGIVEYLKTTLNYSANDNWIDKFNKIDCRRNTNWQNNLKIGKYY